MRIQVSLGYRRQGTGGDGCVCVSTRRKVGSSSVQNRQILYETTNGD